MKSLSLLLTIAVTAGMGIGSPPGPAAADVTVRQGSGLPDQPKPKDADVTPIGPVAPPAQSEEMRRAYADAAALASKPVVWPTVGRRSIVVGIDSLRAPSDPIAAVSRHADAAASIDLQVLDQAMSRHAGLSGFLFTARRGDAGSGQSKVRLSFDYSGFAHAYGGDWASRLKFVALPACVLTTPQRSACTTAQSLRTDNDARSRRVGAELSIANDASVFAVTAGSESSTGDYAATALSPSASWSAGGSSGDFTWSYPLRVPPVGGPSPKLSFQYSAQSLDGRTAATNNQASWAGEGFEFGSSYVERKYASCDQEGHAGKFDLCWKYDNAILVMNGKANELVRSGGVTNGASTWRLKDDDGSRVEKVIGTVNNYDTKKEYWKVTTQDGTQYFFGLHVLPTYTTSTVTDSVWTVPVASDNPGEPCYNAAGFASSFCYQPWRWNLDYVVDPNGNAMSYWYQREFNYYARNGVASPGALYIRGGILNRIDYGQRSNSLVGYKPMQVVLTTAERCLADCSVLSEQTKSRWPDVPFDQVCDQGKPCTDKLAPTFFSRRRLYQIKTQVWKGSAYQAVDFWQTDLRFPSSGDSAGSAMWLENLSRRGEVGTAVSLPNVHFEGARLMNRVDVAGGDGLNGLHKFRIGKIVTETGAEIAVNYAPRECAIGSNMPAAKDNNTKRCFPVRWTPPREVERHDWFHKYVVQDVSVADPTGTAETMVTSYVYSGGAAWHYQETALLKENDKTWSDWRGYGTVTTLTGDPNNPGPRGKSTTTYFRGMDGDKLETGTKNVDVRDSEGGLRADAAPLAGQPREQISYQEANSSAEVSGTITDYFRHQTAAYSVPWGTLRSHFVDTSATKTRTARDGGRPDLVRTVVTDYDTQNGLPIMVNDYGDSAKIDEICTLTSYAKNATAWLMKHPSRVVSSEGECGATSANPPADKVLSDIRTLYDNLAYGAAPTKGNVTATQRLNYYDTNGVAQYQTTQTNTYDTLGRVTSVKDALNRTTATAYSPADNWPATQTVVTQPAVTVADGTSKGFTTKTAYLPEWGLASQVTDANSKVTDLTYDGLGRLTNVYLPSHPKSGGRPNLTHVYSLRNDAASSVRTDKLNHTANGYLTSYTLFDSLLRPRQTQTPGVNGGRIITESRYDSRGLNIFVNKDVWDSGAPSATLVGVPNATVPSETMNTYDGAGRLVNAAFRVYAVTKWSTTTRYGGDTVTVLPPLGGSATATVSDIRSQVIERREYDGNTTSGGFDTTRYTHDLAGRMTQMVGAGGTWTYTYDLQGRKIRSADPDSGTTTSAYDAVDRLVSTTDAEQNKLIRSYDALNRKTALHKTDTTDANQLAAWTYDEPGMYGQQYSSIRYTAGKTGPRYRTTVLTRNVMYKPTVVDISIPGTEGIEIDGTYQTRYGYSADQQTVNFTSVSNGGGLGAEDISIQHNALGLPTRMSSTNATYVAGVNYSPFGDPQQYDLGSNSDMFLSNIYEDGTRRLQRSSAGDVTVLSDHIYSYDPAGNVIRDENRVGSDTQCFDYDGHRRLTQTWTPASGNCATAPTVAGLGGAAPYWQSWTYTSTGLRKTQVDHASVGDTTSTYTYNTAQPHTLAKVSSTGAPDKVYDYDARGNTTTRPGQNLTWDGEGKLTKLTESNGSTEYVYDAEGALLVRRNPTHTTLFLGELEVTLDKATRQTRGKRQYSINGKVFAVRSANGTPTSDLHWLISDYHQTTHVAVDAPTLQATIRYTTPFGSPRGTAPPAWPENRGFLGKPEDKATGLTTVGAREYDPLIGRFISVDPILDTADPQSLLGFAYANNNPVSMWDPTGLMNDHDDGGGGGGSSEPPSSEYPDHEGQVGLTRDNPRVTVRSAASSDDGPRDHEGQVGMTHLRRHRDEGERRYRETMDYIYREMRANANSEAVDAIRTHMHFNRNTSAFAWRLRGLWMWKEQVCAAKCPWDHKPALNRMFDMTSEIERYWPVPGRRQAVYYDIWSNLHFGYVGRKAGIGRTTLQKGAAASDRATGVTDRGDVASVDAGMDLFDKYGDNLTKTQLENATLELVDRLTAIGADQIRNLP